MTYDTPERRARAQRMLRKVLDLVATDKAEHHADPVSVNVAIGALISALSTVIEDVHPDERDQARRLAAQRLLPAGMTVVETQREAS